MHSDSLPLPVGHYCTSDSFIIEIRYWKHCSPLIYRILTGSKCSVLRNSTSTFERLSLNFLLLSLCVCVAGVLQGCCRSRSQRPSREGVGYDATLLQCHTQTHPVIPTRIHSSSQGRGTRSEPKQTRGEHANRGWKPSCCVAKVGFPPHYTGSLVFVGGFHI